LGKFYERVYRGLSRYVRQAAWFSAVPEPESRKSGEEAPRKTRAKSITDNGGKLLYPPVYIANHLLEYLWEIGPVEHGGMGMDPVSYREIESWRRGTGIELKPWELRMLRRLSQDYITELNQSAAPDRSAPFGDPYMQFSREIVGKKVSSAMRALAKKE